MKDSLMDKKCYFTFHISLKGEMKQIGYKRKQEFLERQSQAELFKLRDIVKSLCAKEDMFYDVKIGKREESWMIICEIKYFKMTHVVKKFYFFSYDDKKYNFRLFDLQDEECIEDTTNAQNEEIEENTEPHFLDEYIAEINEKEDISEKEKVEAKLFESEDESWGCDDLSIEEELLQVESYMKREEIDTNASGTKEGSTVNIHGISSRFESVISLKDAEDHTQDNMSSEEVETEPIFLYEDHERKKLGEDDTQDNLTTDPYEMVETDPALIYHLNKKLGEYDFENNLPNKSAVVETEPMLVYHAERELGEDDFEENLPDPSEVVEAEPMFADHVEGGLGEDDFQEGLPGPSEVVETELILVDHTEEKLRDDVSETQNTPPLNIDNLDSDSSINDSISELHMKYSSSEEVEESTGMISAGSTETPDNTSLIKEKAKRKKAKKQAKIEREKAVKKYREFLADWDANLKREEEERKKREKRNEDYRILWDAKLEEERELYKRVRLN